MVLVGLVLVTASGSAARLGAPSYWAWVLTGLQITALWGAGSGHGWAWPLGAAMQPPWIAYAIVTGQVGFVAGCVVSGAVQTANILRQAKRLPAEGPEQAPPVGSKAPGPLGSGAHGVSASAPGRRSVAAGRSAMPSGTGGRGTVQARASSGAALATAPGP